MKYRIRIRRQKGPKQEPYWQEFTCETEKEMSVSEILQEINRRSPLCDSNGEAADPIAWESGCGVRKCGACAMRINGVPGLACSSFPGTKSGRTIVLEPLGKFPVVRDLIVDRTAVFDQLKKIHLWLKSSAQMLNYTHSTRFQSAKCLMCGICLEVCPNFSTSGSFSGAIGPVNAFRILDEETEAGHYREISDSYRKHFFEKCGKSLACVGACPAGIPVEELMVRSNAAAIWRKK